MLMVNGKEIELKEELSLMKYLEKCGYAISRVAVEMNGAVVPKYRYSEIMLKDGDRLEVVSFVGGG